MSEDEGATEKGGQELQKLIRQEKVKKLLICGLNIREISDNLKVCPKTTSRDIKEIRETIIAEVTKEPLTTFLSDFLLMQESIIRECWRKYYAVNNESVQVGILNSLQRLFENRIKILQTLGIITPDSFKRELPDIAHLTMADAHRILDEDENKDIIKNVKKIRKELNENKD